MAGVILCGVVQACFAVGALAHDPLPPTNAMWYRYYSAGAGALAKHDDETAKKYLFAALSTVEKEQKPGKGDVFFVVRLSALEQGISSVYPKDWSKEKGEDASKVKLQEEQVAVLERIAKLNQRLIEPGDIIVGKSQERFQKAAEMLKKTKEQIAQKKGEQSSSN